jgi:multidrug efflux pump subunit AcrA (membrane-fusion protein)
VIVLPDESIFINQGKSNVYVIKDSKTILTSIELGLRSQDRVEIVKGLVKGDVVVSQGQGRLSEGMKIRIYDPKMDQKYNTKNQVAREKLNELNRIFR